MSELAKSSAATYEAHKDVLNSDLAVVLPPILEKLEWGSNELILDHGCSSGSTALKYFVPYAEKNNSTIYALDNCEKMIAYGSEHHSHPTMKYVCGTLTSDTSPVKDLKFNKIFSLYTLQFIDDYRRELKALYDALAPGGDLYLITKLHAQFFDLFENLSEHESFGEHAQEHLVIPRWINESEEENSIILRKAFEETGFKIKDVFDKENEYVFKTPGVFANLMLSLNGFTKHLSDEEHDELKDVYHNYFVETETKGHKPHAESANSEYTLHYHSMYVLAKKP